MAARLTRVTLSIPWDDEDRGHPSGWGYDVLLGVDPDPHGREVVLVDFEDVNEKGEPEPV